MARGWYEQAAAQGNDYAQQQLGVMYYLAHGVPQDYAKARQWLEQAAVQGNGTAQQNLAALYFKGQGVPQNDVRAYMWINLAVANSMGETQKEFANNRDEVAGRMTPAQVAEAQRLAQQCQAQQFKGC